MKIYELIEKGYEENHVLSSEYPKRIYSPLFQQYIVGCIRKNQKYARPQEFAELSGLSKQKSLRFFLGMLDSLVIDSHFLYACEDCGQEHTMETPEDLHEYQCPTCAKKFSLVQKEYSDKIKVVFPISEEVIKEVRNTQYM